MFEMLHAFSLGVFALYGAVLLGRWVIARSWHWAAKFVVLVFVAGLVASAESLVLGAPADDLRIFTELLASAGAIAAAPSALTSRVARRNRWIQFGVPAAVLIFLAWTWREQIGQLRDGTLFATMAIHAPAPTSAAPPAGTHSSTAATAPRLDKSLLCADPGLSPRARQVLNCP